jgi:hypothetical protein
MGKIIKQGIIDNIPFWICLIASITLSVAGFIVPPVGKIDSSVLTAMGELLGFSALYTVYVAIVKGEDVKVKHGSTTLTVGSSSDE